MATTDRFRPRAVTGDARNVLTELTELLDRPDDAAIDRVVDRAFEDSALFVSTVLDQFDVPDVDFVDERAAARRHPCGERETWSNYVGTQVVQPFEIACPRSIAKLREAVLRAAADRIPIRAVGSHHAWSDAALTDGMVLETHGVREPLKKADASELRDPAAAATLRWIPGGMRIQEINESLNKEGLALINMGGYDGQTLAGVISTSTHGSGITLGAFPSFVAALLVMKADGSLLQIEPSIGPTDQKKFKGHGASVPLIQDDDLFAASVVGIGCLGIIVGVLLQVTKRYFLKEVRTIEKWTALRARLAKGDPIRNHRHVEVWINPHKLKGDHACLVTVRDETAEPSGPTPRKKFRALFSEFLASLPGADRVLAWLFNTFPKASPKLIERAIKTLEDPDEYTELSYEMLNIGATNDFAALSAEFGVDLERHVEAADAMLAVAAAGQPHGTFHSGPIVLRYVAASPGFLSMQPRETCMFELPLLRDVFGADSLIWRYEHLLTQQFSARPHWGQRNFLSGNQDMIRALYGARNVDRWLAVFATFNPNGEFASRFTDRVGFTSHRP